MSVPTGSYAVITPARDEASSLPRLAQSLAGQTVLPTRWLIVDNGSTDGTLAIAEELAREHGWIEVLTMPGTDRPVRGGAVVRAFHFGLEALSEPTEIVVNLNADISFESDYFARLLGEFAADPELGMASGSCYEEVDGEWRQRHVTGTTVWGAARAYRRACLDDVLPLEERMALGRHRRDEGARRAAGTRRRSPTCRSAITARRASATVAAAGPAPRRATPRTTSATGPRTSCCARSITRAASRPRCS